MINGTKIVKLRNPWGAGEWKGEWGDDWIVEHANSKLRNINSEQRAKLGMGSTDRDRPRTKPQAGYGPPNKKEN